MRVDDFIVLGRTVPEDSKKYGQTVCMAGYSPELREFMRIYPMQIQSEVKALYVLSAELERNNRDSRAESWTLKTREEKSSLKVVDGPVDKEKLYPVFEKSLSESIDYLNSKKRSLGVIKPDSFEVILKSRKHVKHPDQISLFDDFQNSFRFKTANEYFTAPYIRIICGSTSHCIQIREWGVYELIRKYGHAGKMLTPEDVRTALHLSNDKDNFFIVGNMNTYRNNWLIIKAFSYKKKVRQQKLFDS